MIRGPCPRSPDSGRLPQHEFLGIFQSGGRRSLLHPAAERGVHRGVDCALQAAPVLRPLVFGPRGWSGRALAQARVRHGGGPARPGHARVWRLGRHDRFLDCGGGGDWRRDDGEWFGRPHCPVGGGDGGREAGALCRPRLRLHFGHSGFLRHRLLPDDSARAGSRPAHGEKLRAAPARDRGRRRGHARQRPANARTAPGGGNAQARSRRGDCGRHRALHRARPRRARRRGLAGPAEADPGPPGRRGRAGGGEGDGLASGPHATRALRLPPAARASRGPHRRRNHRRDVCEEPASACFLPVDHYRAQKHGARGVRPSGRGGLLAAKEAALEPGRSRGG